MKDFHPTAITWQRGKLALAFGVAVALNLMTFWNLDLAIRQQVAAVSAEARALAMSVAPVRIPDADNAALVYGRVFEWIEGDESRIEPWNEQCPGKFPPPDDFDYANPDLDRLLKQDAAVLNQLRRGAGLPGCRFDFDYLNANVAIRPEFSHIRTAARMLTLSARNRSAKGDFRGAAEDVNALFSIARHAGDGPNIIWIITSVALDQWVRRVGE